MSEDIREIGKKRERSSENPATNLKDALFELQEVSQNLGRGPYSREAIAQAMGYKGLSGTSIRKVAALVHFGLLRREGSRYFQSELANKILLPISDDDKHEAIAESARQPELYNRLLEKFVDHSLPTMLPNILVRDFGINPKVSNEVSEIFKSSLEFAGLLKNGVVLKAPGGNTNIINNEINQPISQKMETQRSEATNYLILPFKGGIVINIPSSELMAEALTSNEFRVITDAIKKYSEKYLLAITEN